MGDARWKMGDRRREAGGGRRETGEYLLDCSFCSSFHRGTVMQVSPLFLISEPPSYCHHPLGSSGRIWMLKRSSSAAHLVCKRSAFLAARKQSRESGEIRMYLVSLIDMPTALLPSCLLGKFSTLWSEAEAVAESVSEAVACSFHFARWQPAMSAYKAHREESLSPFSSPCPCHYHCFYFYFHFPVVASWQAH